MQNTSYNMLVNATGQLMQQHAFDHLPDEKINRIRLSFQRLANDKTSQADKAKHSNELLGLCSEADLYNDTATPQVLQQWFAVVNCFGLDNDNPTTLNEKEVK